MKDISLYANYGRESVVSAPFILVVRITVRKSNAHLLPETDTRTGVEGQEDERVLRHVFLEPFVEETVGIKLFSYNRMSYVGTAATEM